MRKVGACPSAAPQIPARGGGIESYGGGAMNRYFFVVVGPDQPHDDEVGTPLADDCAALGYARRIIRELKDAGGYDDPRLAMIVQSELRQPLFTIPFSNEIVEPSGIRSQSPPSGAIE